MSPADAEQAAANAEREQRIERYLAEAEVDYARATIPIQFWGRVIDQANEPVPGVEVAYEFSAYIRNSQGDMKRTQGTVLTDAAGRFFIGGIRGHSLTIKQLTKTGYATVGFGPNGEWFSYAKLSTQGGEVYRPDASAPRVYKMERLGEPQPLASYNYNAEVSVNGPPLRSPTGNGMLAGAFRLQFQAGPAANQKKTVYDWTMTVELEGGGVQRSVDEFMSEAPADGYFQKIEVAMKVSQPDWQQQAPHRFFARTAKGHYGHFVLRVAGPYFAASRAPALQSMAP